MNSQKSSIYERQLRIFFLCNALCNSCVIVPRKQGNLAEEKSMAGAKAVLLLSTISTSSEQKRTCRKIRLNYLKSLGSSQLYEFDSRSGPQGGSPFSFKN
ncbi:hypothetical protein [Candidatus Electronema sp. JC]|uniref:hypothetical protein n=1 Tax=Candidatus Electronema sp. JC TaxID=3401570 RepID=UPI003B435ECB